MQNYGISPGLYDNKSQKKYEKKEYNDFGYEFDENVRLVPDRWSKSGWKYVTVDPED